MKFAHTVFSLTTTKQFDFVDATEDVRKFAEESGVRNGLVNVQILHTSAALVLNENEPLLLEDFQSSLERMAPNHEPYRHDDFSVRTVNMCDDECDNGHAHCKAIRLLSTITLNMIDGRVQLGQWQRILFLELDRSRDRKYQVVVMGK